jgi:hypothetical protein
MEQDEASKNQGDNSIEKQPARTGNSSEARKEDQLENALDRNIPAKD